MEIATARTISYEFWVSCQTFKLIVVRFEVRKANHICQNSKEECCQEILSGQTKVFIVHIELKMSICFDCLRETYFHQELSRKTNLCRLEILNCSMF